MSSPTTDDFLRAWVRGQKAAQAAQPGTAEVAESFAKLIADQLGRSITSDTTTTGDDVAS